MTNPKYNMWIEKLDGTHVDCPETLEYPSQLDTWCKEQLRNMTDPEVYVTVWKHAQGENRNKHYSFACWEIPTFAIEMFEDMCKNHDWFYEYSDDHRVYNQGRDSESRLKQRYTMLQKSNIAESAKAIWENYAPSRV